MKVFTESYKKAALKTVNISAYSANLLAFNLHRWLLSDDFFGPTFKFHSKSCVKQTDLTKIPSNKQALLSMHK